MLIILKRYEYRIMARHVDNTKALWKISDDQFTSLVSSCETWFELAAKCDCKSLHPTRVSIDYKPIKKRAQLLQLNISHLCRKNNQYGARQRLPSNKLIARRHTRELRRELQDAGREYVCEECQCANMQQEHGIWLWQGKPLLLQVDHISGRNCPDPDSLDNLRYLCANCHSQTSNWGGCNKGSFNYILN